MQTKLVHLSNIFDPNLPGAKVMHQYEASINEVQRRNDEWNAHLDWYLSHLTGPPKASEAHTVEQLEAMGMVGVYKREKILTMPDKNDKQPEPRHTETKSLEQFAQQEEDEKGKAADDVELQNRRTNPPKQKS